MDDESDPMEAEGCFLLDPAIVVDREYCLRREGRWMECHSVSLSRLEGVREEMNILKGQISEICKEDEDGLRRWRLHTKNTHPLSTAPKMLRSQFNCQETSQAYCKFLEILHRYPLFRPEVRHVRSFHLCEAPGHFISSLDRFLCTFYPRIDWHWEANSLNPHDESTSACDKLLEDDMILRHPQHWHFGDDGIGDIRNWSKDYLNFLCHDGRFDIVTADGSLYTQDNPEDQESLTLPILEAEFRAAKQLLSQSGSLVLKIYTMFMSRTRSLIERIASYFDNVYVFKPMSSKAGNSERYLVCLGFQLSKVESLKQSDAALIDCEMYFSNLQRLSIEANLYSFNAITKEELGIYHDRITSEFQKRTLAKFLASPGRESHLNQERADCPWIDLFGRNYVEILRSIFDKHTALHQLKNFIQEDIMKDDDELHSYVEIEFSSNELEFLEWDERRMVEEMVVVPGHVYSQIKHSLFVPPVLLRCLYYYKPEAVIDLCSFSSCNNIACYVESVKLNGDAVVDASKMQGTKDWLTLLCGVLDAVRKEKLKQLAIIWSDSSVPFMLTRFSASVIAMLSVLFFQLRLGSGCDDLLVFAMPNYPEDIPVTMDTYLTALERLALSKDGLRSFVPPSMLAMFHPYLVDFNRRQWRRLLCDNESVC